MFKKIIILVSNNERFVKLLIKKSLNFKEENQMIINIFNFLVLQSVLKKSFRIDETISES